MELIKGRYIIGSEEAISDKVAEDIISAIKRPSGDHSKGGLKGRAAVKRVLLPQVGNTVIKEYRRGGIIGKLFGNIHLRIGQSRSHSEYLRLHESTKVGINAPQAVAYVHTRGLLYSAWLLTKEIDNVTSLSELASVNEPAARVALVEAGRQIIALIKARIMHIDLHPGNVLVDPLTRVYLIDFDKAQNFSGKLRDLRDFYLCRWRRACIKHKLPDFVSEAMSLELRSLDAWK